MCYFHEIFSKNIFYFIFFTVMMIEQNQRNWRNWTDSFLPFTIFLGQIPFFCHFKNGRKSIFELKKSLKLPEMQFNF